MDILHLCRPVSCALALLLEVAVPVEAKDEAKPPGKTARPELVIPPAWDIWTAATIGDVETIQKHVDQGTDLNATKPAGGPIGTGGTPLHFAAFSGQAKSIHALAKQGANLNARAADADGGTPLHWAIKMGRVEMVKALLDAGADINATDARNRTPLDFTAVDPWNAKQQKLEIAKLLESKGARKSGK
jgi:hypothetical protein